MLCFAFVLLKFVSEFDYQLRKDKVEYVIHIPEDFKSKGDKKLALYPGSETTRIDIQRCDSEVGYIDIVARAKTSLCCDNIIYLRDKDLEVSRKVVSSSTTDTITLRSHDNSGAEIFNLKNALSIDFDIVIRDSSRVLEGHYFDILDIKVHELKIQKPIF